MQMLNSFLFILLRSSVYTIYFKNIISFQETASLLNILYLFVYKEYVNENDKNKIQFRRKLSVIVITFVGLKNNHTGLKSVYTILSDSRTLNY